MYLKHLSLTNFRNFSRLDIDVPRGAVLLAGDNAQGKTSILEALYYLATLTSFHASSERQLINLIAAQDPLAVARIVADYQRGEARHRLEVRIIQEPNGGNGSSRLRKEVILDGVKRKLNEVVGGFNAVLFLPQMLRVIDGAPEERRRYLNLALSQVVPYYPGALAEYTRALTQRNALLKGLNERGGDPSQLDFWDEQLASSGSQLIFARTRAVQELERLAARFHHELTRGEEVLRVCYQPSFDPLPPRRQGQLAMNLDASVDRTKVPLEKIRSGFLHSLAHLRQEEILRGVTTTGPHRDELRFVSNSIDLGTFGSRGQARTVMMSLKLAEVAWMKEKTGQWPVLLLDEVLAELDNQRRADLLSRLSECEQSLLTTTDPELFSAEFLSHSTIWRVRAGRVEETIKNTET